MVPRGMCPLPGGILALRMSARSLGAWELLGMLAGWKRQDHPDRAGSEAGTLGFASINPGPSRGRFE